MVLEEGHERACERRENTGCGSLMFWTPLIVIQFKTAPINASFSFVSATFAPCLYMIREKQPNRKIIAHEAEPLIPISDRRLRHVVLLKKFVDRNGQKIENKFFFGGGTVKAKFDGDWYACY